MEIVYKCRNCSKEVTDSDKFCKHCGTRFFSIRKKSNDSFDVAADESSDSLVETLKDKIRELIKNNKRIANVYFSHSKEDDSLYIDFSFDEKELVHGVAIAFEDSLLSEGCWGFQIDVSKLRKP